MERTPEEKFKGGRKKGITVDLDMEQKFRLKLCEIKHKLFLFTPRQNNPHRNESSINTGQIFPNVS